MAENSPPSATAERERIVNELASVRDDLEDLNWREPTKEVADACDMVAAAKRFLEDNNNE